MAKDNYATKSDIKILKNDIGKLEKNIKNQILNSDVKVLGKLQKMREDNTAHQFSHKRINDELQEHDKRLIKLEAVKA